MVNSPASDVAQLLQDAGVGQIVAAQGWSIQYGYEPSFEPGVVPHSTVTLYDLPGFDSKANWSEEHPAVQARVRGAPNEYLAAYSKAYEIHRVLQAAALIPVGDFFYSARVQGSPAHLGNDEQNRPIFTVTILLMRSES